MLAIYHPDERNAAQRKIVSTLAEQEGLRDVATQINENDSYADIFVAMVRAWLLRGLHANVSVTYRRLNIAAYFFAVTRKLMHVDMSRVSMG